MGTSERLSIISYIGFSAVLLVFVALAGLYLYNIVRWISYPDFGFAPRFATGFHVVGRVTENGLIQGIRIGDVVLEVNGRSFRSQTGLRSAMHRGTYDTNTYLVKRGERQLSVTITSRPIGLKKVFMTGGLPFLLGIAYALIGILVFLMKPHRHVSWVFFLFTIVFGLFLVFLAVVGKTVPGWLESLDIFTFSFVPAVFFHLAFSFPDERAFIHKFPYIQLIPYIVSGLLALVLFSMTNKLAEEPKYLIVLIVFYLSAGVFFFLLSCGQLWLKSTSDITRSRASMVLLGFGISASLPLADFAANALLNVYIVPSFSYYFPFFIIFPLFVGYSIVKHDLFDIDAFIKRTYGYVLTTGVVAGTYGLFVLMTNTFFGKFGVTRSPLFPLVFVLIIVFFFNPVRNRMQRVIDRTFYRLEYDYQETVRRIGEGMRSLMTLDGIGHRMMDLAMGPLFVDHGALLLLNRDRSEYRRLVFQGSKEKNPVASRAEDKADGENDRQNENTQNNLLTPGLSSDGSGTGSSRPEERQNQRSDDIRSEGFSLPGENPLVEKIAERKKEVTLYDIEEDPFFEKDRDACRATFRQLAAALIVPLIYEDRLTGFLSLGRKKSGKFYRKEDISLLNTLASQGAVAIENAFLLEDVIEKERMEEELTIARDLQTSMLPADCPEIPGFELAALSTSAREVGGDFYDFVEMDGCRVGIVIGDVTGKSVSGALVMAASRSVFRMLSEENPAVNEIMNRANRRLKRDVSSGMFVALLYGLLDGNDRTIRLCSAGQTQPVFVSARTGEAFLLQTAGDRFPLGILDEARYEETLVPFSPGDSLVLYTDGIVEAMNQKGEIFGFDRLLDIVRESRARAAGEGLKAIVDGVTAYCEGAPQHDDLTVIVIHATEAS